MWQSETDCFDSRVYDNIFRTMKVLAFIIAATIFEAVGDAVMRIALHYHLMPGRVVLFAVATILLAMYGASWGCPLE
jgi:hypothetical protein